MIPLKDTIPSKSFPVINYLLILANLVVFIFEIRLPEAQLNELFYRYGLVPANILPALLGGEEGSYKILYTFVTNIFLHGGLWHFLGNMLFLFIFGDNVEDRMGKFGYLVFYLLTGVLASATHFVLYIHSPVPAIGASGAISGVMAAYMFLFPKSKVITLIPVFYIIPLFVPIPAFIFIGIWFILQLLSGASHLMFHGTASGIAFWAHIGGFIAGWVLYKMFVKRKRYPY
ncbi:MAG: rhomboid family intramembrane serine protease [Bacteroidales bacterium]|nr:rhomboid family intramembrane serine protease [Bacteroidales bacterium]